MPFNCAPSKIVAFLVYRRPEPGLSRKEYCHRTRVFTRMINICIEYDLCQMILGNSEPRDDLRAAVL